MSKQITVNMRFTSTAGFELWQKNFIDDSDYDYNPEFDSLGDLSWHKAILDECSSSVGIWEIYSKETGKIIDTPRVAVLQEFMKFVEYVELDDAETDHQLGKLNDEKIDELIVKLDELRRELCEILESGHRVSFDKYNEINNLLKL